jgi:hypothetical protein
MESLRETADLGKLPEAGKEAAGPLRFSRVYLEIASQVNDSVNDSLTIPTGK